MFQTFFLFQSLDVTIYDHANSGTKTTRLKKTNQIIPENIFDEIEVVDEIPDDILADSDDNEIEENKNKKPKKEIFERLNDNHVYSDYHMDIWFLISEHISPENVGRFASICRKTDFVVCSSKFWFFMYKKYYNPNIELPMRFQPDCMVRLGGLRSCVIRSLFYFYKPFVGRLKLMESKDFHCLNNKCCIAMWCSQSKDEWEFCFKFKRKNVPGSRTAYSEKLINEKKIIEMFTDIYMNPEEGCQILVVSWIVFYFIYYIKYVLTNNYRVVTDMSLKRIECFGSIKSLLESSNFQNYSVLNDLSIYGVLKFFKCILESFAPLSLLESFDS